MKITRQERKKIIKDISQSSGIAQYALSEKMTDDQLIEASKYLEIFKLLKDSNHYNRYCQKLKTQEANQKLKEFLDIQNSEIINAGKWLISAFSKKGEERKVKLSEKDLVHKEDYNDTVLGYQDSIQEITEKTKESTVKSKNNIYYLQN